MTGEEVAAGEGWPMLLRVTEVGRALGLSRAKVYELLKRGVLPSVRVDGSRRVRLDDLRAYVNGLGTEAA